MAAVIIATATGVVTAEATVRHIVEAITTARMAAITMGAISSPDHLPIPPESAARYRGHCEPDTPKRSEAAPEPLPDQLCHPAGNSRAAGPCPSL